jgi:hypothetical protein
MCRKKSNGVPPRAFHRARRRHVPPSVAGWLQVALQAPRPRAARAPPPHLPPPLSRSRSTRRTKGHPFGPGAPAGLRLRRPGPPTRAGGGWGGPVGGEIFASAGGFHHRRCFLGRATRRHRRLRRAPKIKRAPPRGCALPLLRLRSP